MTFMYSNAKAQHLPKSTALLYNLSYQLVLQLTAPGHILQIFLWVAIQNQIRVAQRVIVDEIIQLRSLCHGHIQRLLDPGAVDGNFSSIPEQQLHAAGVHVEMASSCIVLHNRVLSALRHLYSCDFRYTFFLIRFWTHRRQGMSRELVGAKPLHLLTQTVPSLKSPTGAFIASQTLIFRRKQIIRTHLLSETSSDYFCLVRVARIELTAS